MSKTLNVNCDSVIFFQDRENILSKYDSINFNCDKAFLSEQINAGLAGRSVQFNCDSTTVLKAPERPVRINGLLTLSGGEYAGKYPVCDEVVVTPEGVRHLTALEGMIVLKVLYYPEGADAPPAGVCAAKRVPYPADAEPVIGDVWLREGDGGDWKPNTKYFVSGATYALDGALAQRLKARGTSFHCQSVTLFEGVDAACGAVFSGKKTLIPDGYAFVKDAAPLLDLYATHGGKIYLMGDLTVHPRDVRHLERFESIIVRKTAHLPLEHFEACKKVIKAEKISLFEGELISANGFQTFSHAMLSAACANGVKYTVHINGFALFDDDVTYEDVQAIVALHVNGALSAPGVAHAHLSGVASKINGALLPSIAELKKMAQSAPDEAAKLLGGMAPPPLNAMLGIKADESEEGAHNINCDSYVLL